MKIQDPRIAFYNGCAYISVVVVTSKWLGLKKVYKRSTFFLRPDAIRWRSLEDGMLVSWDLNSRLDGMMEAVKAKEHALEVERVRDSPFVTAEELERHRAGKRD